SWWEHFGQYHDLFEPWQFAYHFMTRSISDGRLARRAPGFIEAAHHAWARENGAEPLETPLDCGAWTSPTRTVAVELDENGSPARVAGPPDLPLGAGPGRRGTVIEAPEDEAGLPDAYRQLAGMLDGAALVAVHGGSSLTRTLLCERVRMVHGLPALLIEPTFDTDRATTAVLSGRADLVGSAS